MGVVGWVITSNKVYPFFQPISLCSSHTRIFDQVLECRFCNLGIYLLSLLIRHTHTSSLSLAFSLSLSLSLSLPSLRNKFYWSLLNTLTKSWSRILHLLHFLTQNDLDSISLRAMFLNLFYLRLLIFVKLKFAGTPDYKLLQ